MDLHAELCFEIELSLSGSLTPGYPERPATLNDPGEPGEPPRCEDAQVTDIGVVTYDFIAKRHVTTSILAGVDQKSAAYLQIVANIMALKLDEAEEALLQSA